MDLSEDRRRLELAFLSEDRRRCLSRARKALRHFYKLSIANGMMSPDVLFESSSEMEDLVIALQHVYKACNILNEKWPKDVSPALLRAANRFVEVWNTAGGADLRHAYSHYEEALSDRKHRLREDVVDDVTWHKIEYTTAEGSDSQKYTARPHTVVLLGKRYSLDGVYEAVLDVEGEFRTVFAPIATRVEPSGPDEGQIALPPPLVPATGNFGIIQQHNFLGGGVDWERKEEIDATRNDVDV